MWRRIFFLLAISGAYATAGNCRVLALAGGTDRGAYEAGAIIGLINNLPAGGAQYNVITGIGVGAVNGLILTNYAIGQEAAAASKLASFWTSFTYETFYTDWIGGIIVGLLKESGLYDTSPLKKTITGLTPKKFERWLGVGATDLISGNYVFFNSSSLATPNFEIGVRASATEPGFFNVIPYNTLQLVSGHIKFSVDLLSAVNQCYNLGYAQNQIIAHVILGGGLKINQVDAINYKTLQVTKRYFEIAAYDSFLQVVKDAQHDFPEINIQYTIYPSAALNHTLYPYDFTPQELADQLALGQQDALNAIKAGITTQ